MSVLQPESIACPQCGRVHELRVAASVNATRNPELRKVIMDGGFQRVSCHCGGHFRVESEFLWIDWGRRQWVAVFPPDREPGWPALESRVEELWRRDGGGGEAPASSRSLTRQITLRTVFGVAALREKLVAWESGIDDAVVAALSLQILRDGMRSLRPEVRPRLVQVAPQALVFQGSEGEHWELPRERYDEALVSPYWVDVVDALSAGTYVDPGRVLFR